MNEHDRPHRSVRSAVKRTGDLVVAAAGLVLLAPMLAAVALAIVLSQGRPVMFRQVRSGYRGRPFTIYKFCTMREAYRADGVPLPDAERLTRLGRLLRRASLDELPQLWNVLRGDLSLVGPRPQLAAYLPLYTPEQARRHEVRPGITGWAQVHGRNAIGWAEKFRHDLWYVDHWSPALDVKILAMTVTCVLRCEGITERGAATVTPFRGRVADEA